MKTFLLIPFTLLACGGSTETASSDAGGASKDGGSSDVAASPSPDASRAKDCVGATQALCERGAACGEGKPRLAYGASRLHATETHNDVKECANYYKILVCPKGPAVDFAACVTSLGEAVCAATNEGQALVMPSQCEGLSSL